VILKMALFTDDGKVIFEHMHSISAVTTANIVTRFDQPIVDRESMLTEIETKFAWVDMAKMRLP
jgi:hypothetical protein